MKKRKLLLTTLIIIALSLAACGGGAAPAPAAPVSEAAPAAAPDAAPAAVDTADSPPRLGIYRGATVETAEATDSTWGPPAPDTDYFQLPILAPDEAGDRRLVYTVTLQLQTTEFLPGMRLLLNTVAELNGYQVESEVWGYDLRRPGMERSAEFRFRVPTENLAEFIFIVENNFNIWHLRQQMQERTAEYREADWVLEDLREEEAALQEAIETATGGARAELLERLRDVQRAIRSREVGQAEIMTDVIYSTVDIQLFEAIPRAQEEGEWPVLFITIFALAVVGVIIAFLVRRKPPTEQEIR